MLVVNEINIRTVIYSMSVTKLKMLNILHFSSLPFQKRDALMIGNIVTTLVKRQY